MKCDQRQYPTVEEQQAEMSQRSTKRTSQRRMIVAKYEKDKSIEFICEMYFVI